jgi:hypothetical protein
MISVDQEWMQMPLFSNEPKTIAKPINFGLKFE